METIYDVLILGGGPAGLSAGIYTGRARLSTLLLEQGMIGGQIAVTDSIENYPGQMPEGEKGTALVDRMVKQAERFGVKRDQDIIKEVHLDGLVKELVGYKGTYKGKTLIVATGAVHKAIGCKGENEFKGRGVSYCATCDGDFFSGLDVYVVGGGDSAVQEAIFLTNFARKVYIIHRRDQLRAVKVLQEKAFANPKIEILWDSVIDEVGGQDVLTWIKIKNTKTGKITTVKASPADGLLGVFGFIGLNPASTLFEGKLTMDQNYIVADDATMATNIPGVFVAGDVHKKMLRQVVTAAADGAIAAVSASKYIENLK